jgi:hypothetical protein
MSPVTPPQPPPDAAPLGCIGIGAIPIVVEPPGSWRAAGPPFAQHRPITEQGRHDVDDLKPVDVAGRVGARQEGHCLRRHKSSRAPVILYRPNAAFGRKWDQPK